jgi:hypothetical protein
VTIYPTSNGDAYADDDGRVVDGNKNHNGDDDYSTDDGNDSLEDVLALHSKSDLDSI